MNQHHFQMTPRVGLRLLHEWVDKNFGDETKPATVKEVAVEVATMPRVEAIRLAHACKLTARVAVVIYAAVRQTHPYQEIEE